MIATEPRKSAFYRECHGFSHHLENNYTSKIDSVKASYPSGS